MKIINNGMKLFIACLFIMPNLVFTMQRDYGEIPVEMCGVGLSVRGENGSYRILYRKEDTTFDPEDTPLMKLIRDKADLNTIKRFLDENTVDVNETNIEDDTPIFLALEQHNEELVSLLCKNGVLIDKECYCGYTPICFSVCKKDELMIRLLLDLGADINAKDLDGDTALHVAVWQVWHKQVIKDESLLLKRLSMIAFLIKQSANIFECNRQGYTPLQLAKNLKLIETQKVFADPDSYYKQTND